MCGRFTLTTGDREWLARQLGVPADALDADRWRPRYNIAPTDLHWVLRLRREDRELLGARWGLAQRGDPAGRRRPAPINARSESAARAPAYRRAFARRRCAVPADGFFEWSGPARARRPHWFRRPDGGLLLFAGLYDLPQPPGGGRAPAGGATFTILTTAANRTVAAVHDRMPAILPEERVDDWLFEGEDDLARLEALLAPAPDDLLVATPVSRRVNSVRHDDPACVEPEARQLAL